MSSIHGPDPSRGSARSLSTLPSTRLACSGRMAFRAKASCFSRPSGFQAPDSSAAIQVSDNSLIVSQSA